MRFASIESVVAAAEAAVRRFPFPLAGAWAACAVFDALIWGGGEHPRALAAGFMLTLGIPLCFAVALRAERSAAGRAAMPGVVAQLAVLVALATLTWLWPQWTGEVQVRRYAQLSLLVHALAAFLPYIGLREPNGFWQYNRVLLGRFVLATIFSAVLLAGLEGALASLRPLFGIRVPGKAFAVLATWVGFVFHPWFFLAGIPRDLGALESRRDYPATMRILAQFILVPLVAVYQLLLTAYLLKVVVTGNWPSGLIGWLVSAEAIAGVLAILLVHPVRDRVETLWVRTFARGFYIAMIPSVVMLALSIAKRVAQYGVTEDRYFVIALTAWFGAISLFFIVRRDGDIRWIPVTLALLALLTFGGPWGAYGVSLASQRARLVHLLEANGMWSGGQGHAASGSLPFPVRRELSGVLDYLVDHHGEKSVRRLLDPALDTVDSTSPPLQSAHRIAKQLGFAFVNRWEPAPDSGRAFSWTSPFPPEGRNATPVGGFAYHVRIDGPNTVFRVRRQYLAFWCDDRGRRLILGIVAPPGTPLPPRDTLAFIPLDPLVAATRGEHGPGAEFPAAPFSGPGAQGLLRLTMLSGTEQGRFTLYGISGDLFFTPLGAAADSIGAIPRP